MPCLCTKQFDAYYRWIMLSIHFVGNILVTFYVELRKVLGWNVCFLKLSNDVSSRGTMSKICKRRCTCSMINYRLMWWFGSWFSFIFALILLFYFFFLIRLKQHSKKCKFWTNQFWNSCACFLVLVGSNCPKSKCLLSHQMPFE